MFGTSVNLYNTDCHLLFGFHGLLFHTLCHLSHLIQHHEVKGYICRESNRMTVSDWAAKDVEALKLTGFFKYIYFTGFILYVLFLYQNIAKCYQTDFCSYIWMRMRLSKDLLPKLFDSVRL